MKWLVLEQTFLLEMGGFAEELLYQKYPFVPVGGPINILILSLYLCTLGKIVIFNSPLWLPSAQLTLSGGEMIEKYLYLKSSVLGLFYFCVLCLFRRLTQGP